jgi:hypothetical protein
MAVKPARMPKHFGTKYIVLKGRNGLPGWQYPVFISFFFLASRRIAQGDRIVTAHGGRLARVPWNFPSLSSQIEFASHSHA